MKSDWTAGTEKWRRLLLSFLFLVITWNDPSPVDLAESLLMIVQVALAVCSKAAGLALIRFLCCVQVPMNIQVASTRESLRTFGAPESASCSIFG